jgi:F-box/TPR repeat protein Pof3
MLLTALDYRAAAHEKLQQLQPALLDAKRMIDLKPDLSKVKSPALVSYHNSEFGDRGTSDVARSCN